MEDKKNDSGQSKLEGFFAGKGFYIVLFLCIAVIGVSAWTLLSSGKSAVQNVSLDDIELSQPVVATPAPTEAAETVWEIPEDASEEEIEKYASEAASEFTYGTNMRGSADYRRHLTEVLLRREISSILAERR